MNTPSRSNRRRAGRVQQLVAPRDRAAQRPLALRDVGRPRARQVEPALEPLVDRGRREEPDPRGGQLDRERHAAEVGDDRGDVAGVGAGDREARLDRAPPGDEQADGLEAGEGLRLAARGSRRAGCSRSSAPEAVEVGRGGQAGNRVLLLAGDPQRGSTRGEESDLARRGAAAPRGRIPRRAPARGCRATSSACFGASSAARTSIGLRDGSSADPHRAGDRRDDETPCRATRPQRHEPGAVRVLRRRGLRRPAAARRVLPVPPGPGQRDQPRARQQGARTSSSSRSRPTNDVSCDRQVVGPGVERADRREVRRAGPSIMSCAMRSGAEVLEPVGAQGS